MHHTIRESKMCDIICGPNDAIEEEVELLFS
jgi:hypothetical protein